VHSNTSQRFEKTAHVHTGHRCRNGSKNVIENKLKYPIKTINAVR